MKKRALYLAVSMSILLLAAGCNKKDDNKQVEGTPTPAIEGTTDTDDGTGTANSDTTENAGATGDAPEYLVNELVKEEYKIEDYIALGQYKGIEITVAPAVVTEEDLQVAIQSELGENGATLEEITGRAVKRGDTVNIDYEGLKDGVAFEGGTFAGHDLMIGSNSFIPGFEDGIIGAKTGDKLDLNITFPENYDSQELAGQPVVFKVTVNKIQEYKLTEDYVTENTEYANIEQYKAALKDSLMEEKEASRQAEIEYSIYNNIVAASTISSLPQTLLDYYKNDMKVYYSNFAMAYGMDFAGFLSISGVTEEEFDKDAEGYAKNMATRDLVYNAIIKAEGMELSEEEYNEKALLLAEEYGYESIEDFMSVADPDILREEIMMNMVSDFIVAEAIVK